MIVKGAAIGAALDKPNPDCRFFLFHGPDEAGSRALATRLVEALGAEKFALPASTIRADSASLVDEACAMALFGGPRVIWVDPAGDEIAEGVAALFEALTVESAVVAIAGSLRKSGPLLKLVEPHRAAVAIASYVPEGRDAARMIVSLGRAEGLAIDTMLAERMAEETGGNHAIAAGELAKFALFLGASPETPKTLTHEVIDALGCGGSEGDQQRLGDLALDGDLAALIEELERSGLAAKDGVTVLRALQRRLMSVIPLSARIAAGESRSAVMTSAGRAIFWKEKDLVERMLRTWRPERLARLVDRTALVEKELMLGDSPEVAAISEHLVMIGRAAQRGR